VSKGLAPAEEMGQDTSEKCYTCHHRTVEGGCTVAEAAFTFTVGHTDVPGACTLHTLVLALDGTVTDDTLVTLN